MNEDALAVVIFGAICVSSAFVVHWHLRSYWAATILSALLSVVLVQVVAYIDLGYLDPFFLMAVATSSVAAFVISSIVGAFFKVNRNKSASEQGKPT